LEPHDLGALGYPTQSPEAFDVLASAIRVGNADNRVNSDPNWATVPAVGATSDAFAAERAELVGAGRAIEEIDRSVDPIRFDDEGPDGACEGLDSYPSARERGEGEVDEAWRTTSRWDGTRAAAPDFEATTGRASAPVAVSVSSDGGETTHMSVVDAEGNAVALTQTNSSVWGSGASVSGFFLNDSGIDFSRTEVDGTGENPWRIRNSTIAPTIVLRDGEVRMVVGAPGGGRIQPAILQTIIYVLDYGLDPLDALRMPRMYPSANETQVETENGFNTAVLAEARAMGYTPTPDA